MLGRALRLWKEFRNGSASNWCSSRCYCYVTPVERVLRLSSFHVGTRSICIQTLCHTMFLPTAIRLVPSANPPTHFPQLPSVWGCTFLNRILMRYYSATDSRSRSWFTEWSSDCTARDLPIDLGGGGIASFRLSRQTEFGTVPFQSARRNGGGQGKAFWQCS